MNDLAMLLIGFALGVIIDRVIIFIFKKTPETELHSSAPIVPDPEKRHNENKV